MKAKNKGLRRAATLALLAAILGTAPTANDGASANVFAKETATVAATSKGTNAEAERLYRRGSAWAFGLEGRKIDVERGFRLLSEAAELGSVDAKAALAELYFCNARLKNDKEKGGALTTEAAEAGDPIGLLFAGLRESNDAAKREALLTDALIGLKERAENGDVRAQTWLAQCYFEGLGDVGEIDYRQAARWYRKADEAGSAGAAVGLGVCFNDGKGVEQNQAEATRLFRKAAELGDVVAMRNLGICLFKTDAKAEAASWMRKAAEAGDAIAMRNWGIYLTVVDAKAEAAPWFRKAAEAGDAIATHRLAVCYEHGDGVEQDYVEAARLMRIAAENAETVAMLALADYCEKGVGGEQDLCEAFGWRKTAAEMGDAAGMLATGVCYFSGVGVEQDDVAAARWFRAAANAGNAIGAYNLGVCYNLGRGVERDLDESARWFRKADELGEPDAKAALRELKEAAEAEVARRNEAKSEPIVAPTSDATTEKANERKTGDRKTGKVGGVATLDGRPLANATLRFIPVDARDGAPSFVAKTNERGEYEESAAVPGEYLVTIVCFERVETGRSLFDEDGKTPEAEWRNVVPLRYVAPSRVGLKASVAAGNNVCDFEMTSSD